MTLITRRAALVGAGAGGGLLLAGCGDITGVDRLVNTSRVSPHVAPHATERP